MNKTLTLIFSVAVLCSCGSAKRTTDESYERETEKINVGYGSVTDEALTYSVSKVRVNSQEISSYNNIFDYLRGRVPGVEIGDASGGGMPTIHIRGINSINLSTQPLFILDGVQTSDISYVNPNDVASVEILKDSSASIYGTRGGNGVIIITTKTAQDVKRQEEEAARAARQARREARKN